MVIPLDERFADAVTGHGDPNGGPGRVMDDVLISLVRSHGEREGAALAAYQRLADESNDEGLRYVVGLIMEDEARHHRQIAEMLNELHSFAWDLDVRPRTPELVVRQDNSLRQQTERLLAFEKEDAAELRRLRKELRGTTGYSLFPLLVSLMLHDTAKHIEILRFIRSRARRR